MICKVCKNELKVDELYCKECGASVSFVRDFSDCISFSKKNEKVLLPCIFGALGYLLYIVSGMVAVLIAELTHGNGSNLVITLFIIGAVIGVVGSVVSFLSPVVGYILELITGVFAVALLFFSSHLNSVLIFACLPLVFVGLYGILKTFVVFVVLKKYVVKGE